MFFDNLQVTHNRGPLLEESHYYPFGGLLAGISSRSAGKLENKRRFNYSSELENKEFSDGSGLEWYATDFRKYDPQIGHFHQIDPLSEYSFNQSPYSFVQNNPITFVDPQGLDTVRVEGEGSHKVKVGKGDVLAVKLGETTSYYTYDPSNKDAVNGFVANGADGGSIPEVTVTTKAKENSSTSSGGDYSWYDWGSRANWGLGASGAGMAEMTSSFRVTNGAANGSRFSPKYYPSGWSGGSKAKIKTFSVGKIGNALGWATLGIGVIMDGVGVYKYYHSGANNPNAVLPGKAALNTAVGAYGLWNPAVGVTYFGVDAFYPGGAQGYLNDYNRSLDTKSSSQQERLSLQLGYWH